MCRVCVGFVQGLNSFNRLFLKEKKKTVHSVQGFALKNIRMRAYLRARVRVRIRARLRKPCTPCTHCHNLLFSLRFLHSQTQHKPCTNPAQTLHNT